MNQIIIEYKQTSEEGLNFIFPRSSVQLSNDMFDKAKSYGVILALPFDLQIQEEKAWLYGIEQKAVVRVRPRNGLFIIPLGLELRVPENHALFHIDLLRSTHNFVIDSTFKEWYKANLYLLATPGFFKKGIPALQILPIPDVMYDFVYRRVL